MTARNRNRTRTAAATARHALDEVLIDQSKTRMKGTAAPVLARINKLQKSAQKNIAKREKFLDNADGYKNEVRTAYDEGDESALSGITASLDAYEKSLLRPSRRNR